MWYPATVTIAAASEPVTLAEAKAQCRVLDSDSDTLLDSLIAAARGHVEAYCGTPLVSRTVTVKCDGFDDFSTFPVAPVSAVSSVTFVDTTGTPQTLSADVYELRSDGLTTSLALKYGQSWPAIQDASRITVTATVGYSTVPPAIKHAILLLIGFWFSQREAAGEPLTDIPVGVDALLSNHRSFSF